MPKIYVAVNDLLVYGSAIVRPTGIQRVASGLSAALSEQFNAETVVVSESGLRSVALPTKRPRSRAATLSEPALWLLSRAPRRLQYAVRGLARLMLGRVARRQGGEPIKPFPGDWIAVIGAPWISPGMASATIQLRSAGSLKIALLVHDLLPATSPQWFSDSQAASAKRDIELLISNADAIFTVSYEVKEQLQQEYRKQATLLMPADPIIGTERSLVLGSPNQAEERIILCVGTLHPRKNLIALVRIWDDWCAKQVATQGSANAVPLLVLAGRRHPQDGELFRALRDRPMASKRIQLIHDADDQALAQLYNRSRFVVMPSLAEGWGLPIREGLIAGRPSIATDAVPAASGSPYVKTVPAGNEEALREAIQSWWLGDTPERLSEAILANFTPRTWDQVGEEFVRAISAAQ